MRYVYAILLFAVATATHESLASEDSTPHWIWNDSDRSPVGQTFQCERSFELATPVAQASLQFAADFCRCEIWLNGKLRAAVDDFSSWPTVDVTEDLRIGRNTITLNGVSGEGPSAIAFRMDVTLADGSEVIVESSPSDAGSVSLGRVLPQLWNPATRVSSFDDYTQWEQAINAPAGTDPAAFATQPGFQIQLLRSAGEHEGSWISMAFDPRGRLTVSREDQGLLRMTLTTDRSSVERVETINDSLLECRGLLYAYGSLYANANNSKGLFRLTDTNGDDQFDDVKLLREFPGGVGHGRNDLALGPDGMIYSIHGDSVDVPRENILDRTSPLRADRIDQESIEGHVIRTDRDGEHWELVATGLRNPYGIDFNADGELFTYDADAEFDMGAPWYRPTRIDHLVSGADFGWRGRTGKWPPYDADHADNSLPVADVGKGSPTSVVSGRHGKFPAPWNDAMFALDWAYGRILACHLQPRGAGYICRAETFVQGRPFNVTDLAFGPDGAMYVITGGRKTQSALYRIHFVGPDAQAVEIARQQSERAAFSKQRRALATQLATFHGRPEEIVSSAAEKPAAGDVALTNGARTERAAMEIAWPQVGSADPTLRHAAQVLIERQPVDTWRQRVFDEPNASSAVTALMMLARANNMEVVPGILRRLNDLPLSELSPYQRRTLLHAYSLCLADTTALDEALRRDTMDRLNDWFPVDFEVFAPIGSGRGVNRELAELLLLRLESADAVSSAVELLGQAVTQEDRLHYLFVLRHSKAGWTIDQRRMYFEVLGELDRSAFSGEGMPDFLRQIRDEATASLNDAERESLGELLQPGSRTEPAALTISRPFVREWTVDALTHEIAGISDQASPERGRQLFGEALCASCHRMHGSGAVIGPDLTSVANRFGRRDLLTSVVLPSNVVAEKYRNMQVVTTDGRVITGRVITGGDYRSKTLRIATDPLRPSQVVEIAKADIESYEPSPTSPMPEGLLNTLSAEDVGHLLAFLESAGSRHP